MCVYFRLYTIYRILCTLKTNQTFRRRLKTGNKNAPQPTEFTSNPKHQTRAQKWNQKVTKSKQSMCYHKSSICHRVRLFSLVDKTRCKNEAQVLRHRCQTTIHCFDNKCCAPATHIWHNDVIQAQKAVR